ncbi:MAG: AIM24 family protein, partial [Vicinamibacterales bacterium]
MMTHEITGDDMQALILRLTSGDEIRAEAGAMTYMTEGIDMDARMTGGLLGGLKRKLLAGESLFLTFFRCTAPSGEVAF